MGHYIDEIEAKWLRSQQTSIEMLTALKNCEFELESALQEIVTLKQYIIDLKSRIAVYIPLKGDVVDRKLAEYINNFPDMEKLERKDPLKRFNEKVAIQKVISGHEAREESPVRRPSSPKKSPTKKAI